MRQDLKKLKEDVTAAGFRGAPLAPLVWTIRRMLWPFIRQYHFLQLEKLLEVEERLDLRLVEIESLAEGLNRRSEETQSRLQELNTLLSVTTQELDTRTDLLLHQDEELRSKLTEHAGLLHMATVASDELTCENAVNDIAARQHQIEEDFKSVKATLNTLQLAHRCVVRSGCASTRQHQEAGLRLGNGLRTKRTPNSTRYRSPGIGATFRLEWLMRAATT